MVEKNIYGAGDTFVVSANLNYQGNLMSAAGDEGGLCYAGDIVQDAEAFWGEVETWDKATRSLVYKPGAFRPQKLGTSRPIINMNPRKWLRQGKVIIVPPGHKYLREDATDLNQSLLIAPAEPGWDASLVGRFLTIDEPSESYAADEPLSSGYAGAPGKPLHRWWHVTALERRRDGRWNLFVERTFWWTGRRGGPTLFRFTNHSTDERHTRPLACIVATGAWASDVRDAVCGDLPGSVGSAGPHDQRTIRLAPFPQMGTRVDFEPNHPITQPLGADVWRPTGNGLQIRGPVEQAALDLWESDGNVKTIQWRLPSGVARLHVDPKTADFVFSGGNQDLQGHGTVRQDGISATATPARNLRGINVAVPRGGRRVTVRFTQPEPDDFYSVVVQGNWFTLDRVTVKRGDGFDVEFSEPAPEKGSIDWQLVR